MDNNVQNDINKVIEDIDIKMEELKSDPAYNEEEGRKQVDAMYDYMKDHPQSTDSILNQTSDINKVIEDIDAKMEEVKSDPAYDEEEGRKQVDAMYDYMKDHPQSTDSLLNQNNNQ